MKTVAPTKPFTVEYRIKGERGRLLRESAQCGGGVSDLAAAEIARKRTDYGAGTVGGEGEVDESHR